MTAGLGWTGIADATKSAGVGGPDPLILQAHYRVLENGRVIIARDDGQQLTLEPHQYVILDGGLLLLVDELVLSTISSLPIFGELPTGLKADLQPVRSLDGSVVTVGSAQSLWSDQDPVSRLSDQIDIERYELAQAIDLDGSTGANVQGFDLASAPLVELGALGVGIVALISSSSGSSVPLAEDGTTGAALAVAGSVIKGPLLNAFVFVDENGNRQFDAGEPHVTTGSDGVYSLQTSVPDASVVVITSEQTIDTISGTMLSGLSLSAPIEATVVTPLTTLLEGGDLSVDAVKSVLGLPAAVDLLTFNPFAAGVDADDALLTEKRAVQIAATLSSYSAVLTGAGVDAEDAGTAVLSALKSVLQSKSSSGLSLDLSDATDLGSIQTAFSAAVDDLPGLSGPQSTAINDILGDATTALLNVNSKVESIVDTDLTNAASANTFGLLQVLTDQVADAAGAELALSGSGSIGFTDPSAVDSAATNAAPTDIGLSAASIAEDAASRVVGVLTATDDSTTDFDFTFELVAIEGSSDHADFTINQANGELAFIDQPDFETQASYTITVKATDEGGKSFTETFTITVTNSANEHRPVFSSPGSVEMAENETATGYTPVATDGDGDSVTYSISGGSDAGDFSLVAGALQFDTAPDFEGSGSADNDNDYEVEIEAADGKGGTTTQTVTVTVTDANDDPVFSSGSTASFAEESTGTVHTAAATDADGDTLAYGLSGGADQALFNLDSSSGALTFIDAPDFETPGSADGNNDYEVQIEAADGNGGTTNQTVTVTVTDVVENTAPTATVTNSLVQADGSGNLASTPLSNFVTFNDATPGASIAVTVSGVPNIILTPAADTGSLSGVFDGVVVTNSVTWDSSTATLTLVAEDDGGLTATTSLTVAQQIDLTEADLNSSAVSYTVNGSKADDSVDLGSSGSLAFDTTAEAHTVTLDLGDGSNTFEALHVGYGANETFSYIGGSGADQAIVNGHIASNDGSASFDMGGGSNSLDLLMTQIRLGKTQGAGDHVTDSVFTYTGGDDADAVTISNSYVGGGADNYVGSDGVVAFNMGNGTNSLTISTGEPTYFSLYDGTVTYTGGTGSDTIDLSTKARVYGGSIFDFGADTAADSLTSGTLNSGVIIRNFDPDLDTVTVGVGNSFTPSNVNLTQSGGDTLVSFEMNSGTYEFTLEGVSLTADAFEVSGDFLIL